MSTSNWRKSSYSSDNGGECVEVASAEGVMVRDTTNRDGATLSFTISAWSAFTASLQPWLCDLTDREHCPL
jgi:hypothetical protein